MRRGFKADAERRALAARAELGLAQYDQLDPVAYANHLGIVVLNIGDLELAPEHRRQLLVVDPDSWSGMTLKEGDQLAIILNPSHPPTRNRMTLMHEISHSLLRHVPSTVQVSTTGLMLLSDYSDDQEDEADWLAAAILMPRDAIFALRRSGKAAPEIAALFGVSRALCEWRLRMTGVETQLRRMGEA